MDDDEEAPAAARPAPLEDVQPQAGIGRGVRSRTRTTNSTQTQTTTMSQEKHRHFFGSCFPDVSGVQTEGSERWGRFWGPTPCTCVLLDRVLADLCPAAFFFLVRSQKIKW